MTNIATNIIKQKVKYSILILYFFVVSCATGSQMVSDNRIYIGMSKQELLSLYYGAAFFSVSEDPFLYHEDLEDAWKRHLEINSDYTSHNDIIDGVGYSITKLSAFEMSHRNGNSKHRSELCNLYIRENMDKFNTLILPTPNELIRKDLRLTVDYPEDLIFCRKIFNNFKELAPAIPIIKIVEFIDNNPELKKLIEPYTEEGYSTMY